MVCLIKIMGLVRLGDFEVCLNLVYKIVLRRWANSMIKNWNSYPYLLSKKKKRDWNSYLPQIRITCSVLHVFSPPQKWRGFCLLQNIFGKIISCTPHICQVCRPHMLWDSPVCERLYVGPASVWETRQIC